MWQYEIATGWIINPYGVRMSQGYSGHGDGLNNIEMQSVKDVGPIPEGVYTIGPPEEGPSPSSLRLTPQDGTQMYGRSGFWMHGDEITHPGEFLASDGCIVAGPYTRQTIWDSGDHQLLVIAKANISQ